MHRKTLSRTFASPRHAPAGAPLLRGAAVAAAVLTAALGATSAGPLPATAQQVAARTVAASRPDRPRQMTERGVPLLRAVASGPVDPVIDGRLDDEAWIAAPVAGDFVQFEPEEGAPASQPTEARVLYGTDALYVALRALDSAPDSIAAQLSRRDQQIHSDWLGVMIDSYHDRRTAFHFMVNPRGVKIDIYRFDDVEEDGGWDAVWDVATATDAEGWTAEFRIPYSQLRFRDAPEQTWGIQFIREIARYDEISAWAPTLKSESAIVSRFGELTGLRGLEAPRRLEVTPYTLARVRRQPGEAGDPFHQDVETFATVGADVKYGVTGDLTLDMTINPDFGQVEADPARVNLSAFETFLPERRPFFVEGSNLFDFSLALGDGDDAVESLFYSRRIGRSPQGRPGGPGAFVDRPDNTTILGALKLSGKTAGGWSIGTLAAVTAEETARVAAFSGSAGTGTAESPEAPAGSIVEETIEPLSTYGVARVSRDFREGRSALGVITTLVGRDRAVADALGIHRSAFSGGVDFRHRFGSDRYLVSGYVLGSHVRGSEDAVTATQRSPARWFQRPDADHVELDPTRTSLSGVSASASVSKIAGGHWRWATGFQSRSPGFEANDAGYLRESDYTTAFAYAGYDQSTPQGPFRRWRLNTNVWNSVSWGMERYGSGGNVNGSFQLSNFWTGYGGVNYGVGGLSNGLLRGGPAMADESRWNGWGGLGTDARKAVRLNLGGHWSVRPESDSWSVGVSPNVTWRPSGRASLSVGPSVGRNVDDRQWVGRIGTGDGDRFVFGRISQTTVSMTARLDYAFSPTLSLQLYAQPFVSAGGYSAFKQVDDPRAERYRDRLSAVDATLGEDGRYRADLDGDGAAESWRDPAFNVKQFRSNAVVRWEYRPGSSLYLVWSQGRSHVGADGAFDLRGDVSDLFASRPDDILMLKMSWWMNP